MTHRVIFSGGGPIFQAFYIIVLPKNTDGHGRYDLDLGDR
jgi:hypothetical protein